jgi:hypothetical protein
MLKGKIDLNGTLLKQQDGKLTRVLICQDEAEKDIKQIHRLATLARNDGVRDKCLARNDGYFFAEALGITIWQFKEI